MPLVDARRIGLVILAASLVLAPHAAAAQSPGRMYWIGYLGNASVSTESCLVDAFRQGLRELGYIEGRNVAFDAGERVFLVRITSGNRRLKTPARDVVVMDDFIYGEPQPLP